MAVSMLEILPAVRKVLLAVLRGIQLVAVVLVLSVVLPILFTRLVVQLAQFVVGQYNHILCGVAQAVLLVAQTLGSAAAAKVVVIYTVIGNTLTINHYCKIISYLISKYWLWVYYQ